MGAKLAVEVEDYISDHHPNLKHLSFIGHSMGGLIIRAALEHLK